MGMGTATNVSASKPSTQGVIFRGAVGTTLPTDATTTLDVGLKSLGYVSEDGIKNNNTPSVEKLKAMGGKIVMTTQIEKPDTYSLKLIEALNAEVLKAVYNADNVTGDLANGITVKANAEELEMASWVIDMIMTGDVIKRVVIPNGKISEIGEISYTDADAVGYEITIECFPDNDGNTHYEYIKAPSALASLTVTSAAGSTSGKTAVTVTPAKASGNSYKYKIGTAAEAVTYDQVLTTGWTAWDGTADITATTGQVITIAEVDTNNKAKGAGHATVTSA